MILARLVSDYNRQQRLAALLVALAVSAVTALGWSSYEVWTAEEKGSLSGFARVDNIVHDQLLLWRNARITAHDLGEVVGQVAVLRIDDRTMRDMDLQWPLPRDFYPDLIRRIKLAGGKTIVLDILFVDRGADPAADEALAKALADPAVILPYQLVQDPSEGLTRLELHKSLREAWTDADRATRTGYTIGWQLQGDGVIRRASLELKDSDGNQVHHSLDQVAWAHHRGIPLPKVLEGLEATFPEYSTFAGSRVESTSAWINYLGAGTRAGEVQLDDGAYQEGQIVVVQPGASGGRGRLEGMRPLEDLINVVSMVDLYQGPSGEPLSDEDLAGNDERPPLLGKDVVVLVGVTMVAGHDLKQTPVGQKPGVEIHADILINMILGNFLEEPAPWVTLFLMVGSGALIGLIVPYFESRLATLMAFFSVGAFVALNAELLTGREFREGGLLLPLSAPVASMVLSYFGVQLYLIFAERAAKENLSRTLREVCPIPDLERILTGQGIELGGEERVLTILFSDIRGYTDLSENMDPVQVKNRLNQYFGGMSEIFDRYGGVIFDYQGDAQMVVFGLKKESQPNHALAACEAGVAMILKMEEMRSGWLERGEPLLETGVGICTGPVSLGFLGSAQHKQYAAIGDSTNTAARIQGKSKELDAPVLVTQSTFEAAGRDLLAQPLEPMKVKGKREPLQVYRVRIEEMKEKRGIRA